MSHSLRLIEVINSTDVSKTEITNKIDTLPLVVFYIHHIFTQEKYLAF